VSYRTYRIVGYGERRSHEDELLRAIDEVNALGERIVQVVPIPGQPVRIMIVEVPE
jgi:hypothetical protein